MNHELEAWCKKLGVVDLSLTLIGYGIRLSRKSVTDWCTAQAIDNMQRAKMYMAPFDTSLDLLDNENIKEFDWLR